MSKKCFKCGQVKPLSDFYKHNQMADGHVNKCKECNKYDVRKNRSGKIDYYRDYDKKRGSRQDYSYTKQYREDYPNKYRAHTAVNNAIQRGMLFKMPCEICGSTESIHGHHDDYLKPLNVRWLCPAHHKEWHLINGEAANP